MSENMNPELILGIRLVLHIMTAALLLSYCRPEARFRLVPSVLAGMLASSSAALAVQIATNWHTLAAANPQPQLVIFVFTVFLPVALARGDMAAIYDALKDVPKRLRRTGSWFH